MRMKTTVVLAKAKGRKVTSVSGAVGEGEVSDFTGDVNLRGWAL
jgi:hypothetical protein